MHEVIAKGASTAAHPTPLLFVHGACSAAWIWDDHFLGSFAEQGHHALALSLRGHGASSLARPLGSCSLDDYAEDVSIVAAQLSSPPVLIGHSMGCWVVLKCLESRGAPAAVLLAPGTPRGLRRWALRAVLRHPWLMVRSNTFGNPVDLFDSRELAREFLFGPGTPESVVASCVNRLTPESGRAARDTVKPLPDPRRVTASMLVLGAGGDASRVEGDASAVAATYRADFEAFPDMGHAMMLEPGWSAVAERIQTWLTGKGL
ncbi:alpha-beta hydrolase superfamily lysophospholipase [Mycobacterium sp. BK558]|nr:alpha-beta hydrolase superfamily lysophospholipase [Mycobacterium sp. BK558]